MAKNQKFTLFLRMVWYNSNLIIEVGWIFFKKSTLRKCEFEEKEESYFGGKVRSEKGRNRNGPRVFHPKWNE